MITEDYCSFEVAKLLKEKGFDIPCHYTYHGDITSVPFFHRKVKNFNGEEYSGKTTEWFSCPTHQMAMAWLREMWGNDFENDVLGHLTLEEVNKLLEKVKSYPEEEK